MAGKDRVFGKLFKLKAHNQDTVTMDASANFEALDSGFYVVDPSDTTKRLRLDAGHVETATDVVFAPGMRTATTVASGDRTLTAAETGHVFLATAASGTQTFTLPAAAAGLMYTFVCGHASGEILITPATGDAIRTMAFGAIGADADTAAVAPAAGTGIKNTAATNVIGDNITLLALDGTTWQGLGIAVGIWASQ
jgi:hypothetical protein